jgi:hypothetical protein
MKNAVETGPRGMMYSYVPVSWRLVYKGFASEIWEAVVLVLLMRGIHETDSGSTIYMSSSTETCSGIQTLIWGIHIQTHREQRDFIRYFYLLILNSSDDGIHHLELLGFCTLSVTRYSQNQKTQPFFLFHLRTETDPVSGTSVVYWEQGCNVVNTVMNLRNCLDVCEMLCTTDRVFPHSSAMEVFECLAPGDYAASAQTSLLKWRRDQCNGTARWEVVLFCLPGCPHRAWSHFMATLNYGSV